MENGENKNTKKLPGKKELKKQLADKMETALPELKELLGEKKFNNRLKKAAKLLMEGLHKDTLPKKEKAPAAQAAAKKANTKKAAVAKKGSKKVPAVKKAIVATKATATKKTKAGKQ